MPPLSFAAVPTPANTNGANVRFDPPNARPPTEKTASASAPHGRIVLVDSASAEPVFVFCNERLPLARRAKPPSPASVKASPARGLLPTVGRNDTNGLTARSDCCANAGTRGVAVAAIPATADERTRVVRCTVSPDGVGRGRLLQSSGHPTGPL